MSDDEPLDLPEVDLDQKIGTVRWFGDNWGAPVCEPEAQIDTPLLAPCIRCNEWFHIGDRGVSLIASPSIHPSGRVAYHLMCFLEEVGAA